MTAIEDLYPHEQIIAISEALTRAAIPHAFGGALVLLYWSEPRGTTDIDIDIALPAADAPRVFAVLGNLGVTIDAAKSLAEATAAEQVRLRWESVIVDLFFAYDPFHDSVNERAVERSFLGHPLRVITAEDIVVFKALFNRSKDWPDIEKVIAVQGEHFDADYTLGWLERILGPGDSALERLRALVEEYRENPA